MKGPPVRTQLRVAVLLTAAMAMPLSGCKDNTSAQINEEIARLAVQYDLNLSAGTGLGDSQRVYTAPVSNGQYTLPADYSGLAQRQDDLNAMVGELETVYHNADASPGQKASVGRILAEIHFIDARYLGQSVIQSYGTLRNDVGNLQSYADQIDSIRGVITIYEGDRDIIVQTLQSGGADGSVRVSGIDQLRERAEAVQALIDASASASGEYAAQAVVSGEQVAYYEQLELELKTKARTLSGAARFDVLDQVIRAGIQARIAEIESEYNTLLADAVREDAARHTAHQEQLDQVIEGLRDRIAQVREEIDGFAAEVRDAKSAQREAVDTLDDQYNQVDGQMQFFVFDRLEEAGDRAEASVVYYQAMAAGDGGQGSSRSATLNAMVLHLQLMDQHIVALNGYQSALEALLANGQVVLGAGLAGDLSQRVGDLEAQIQELTAASGEVLSQADDLAGSLRRGTENGLAQTINGQLDAIRANLGTQATE